LEEKQKAYIAGVLQKKPIPAPPSLDAAARIFRSVVSRGLLSWGARFKKKCNILARWPGFNTVDASAIVRQAQIILGPVYHPRLHGWQYQLGGYAEGRRFALDVVLHCDADYETGPKVTVLNGNYRKWKIRE